MQRFFNTAVSWGKVQWLLIAHHLLDQEDVLLLGGDEAVMTKSGKKTHGLERFFSSLYGKAVAGTVFFEFIADQREAALFVSCDAGAGRQRKGARLS